MEKKTRGFRVTDFVLNWEFWEKLEGLTYVLAGEEICPTTGKDHWQMYIHFKNPRGKKGVIELLKPRWCDYADKSFGANWDYCTKEKRGIKELGKRPIAGSGNALEEIFREIRERSSPPGAASSSLTRSSERSRSLEASAPAPPGAPTPLPSAGAPTSAQAHIASMHTTLWCQYGRRIEDYRALIMKTARGKGEEEVEVFCWWGPPGSGKTRTVFDTEEGIASVTLSGDKECPFVNGYNYEEAVLLDDFEPTMCGLKFMLRFCDRYPLELNVKGGSKPFVAKRIYITSNTDPLGWYGGDKAFQRRIKAIKYFGAVPEQVRLEQGLSR